MAVQRKNPYGNYNFSVDIGASVGEIGFAEAEIPAAEIDVIEYREGNDLPTAVRKLPGRVRYGNIVLRRGIDGELAVWEWFKAVRDGQLEQRNPVLQWRLRDAWPTKYDPSDLNAKGNEVAVELLELAVESIEIE